VFVIKPGELFLIYTDGLTDVPGPSGEYFGTERLMESLYRADSSSIEGTIQSLIRDVDAFRGTNAQFDDICLVGFSRCHEINADVGRAIDGA
jgi:sigma-B regulation protein RsbU (phosphoserine phosphatase)